MNTSARIFVLGVSLGFFAAWTLLSSRFAPALATGGITGAFSVPAWNWRETATPPLMDSAQSASAIAAWRALPPSDFSARATTLRSLLVWMPASAFPALLDHLAGSVVRDDRRLLRLALPAWIRRDPASAARWAACRGQAFADDARAALRAWSELDPRAAAEWAVSIPDADTARSLAAEALVRLAQTDLDYTLALARSGDDFFRDYVLGAVLGAVRGTDPADTVITFAPELWETGRGFWPLYPALSSWAKNDPQAALAWLAAQPREPWIDLGDWVARLGESSPDWNRNALHILANAPGLDGRANAMRQTFFQWGTSNPAEALAWLKQVPDADLRTNLLEIATSGYLTNKPEKNLPLILAMPEGELRAERLSEILGQWVKIDPQATLAWMRANASDPMIAESSAAVHGTLVETLARQDPKAAAREWEHLTENRTRRAAMNVIALAWGESDPAGALQWAESAQAKLAQKNHQPYIELINRWAKTAPESALRWVETWTTNQSAEMRPDMSAHYFDALGGDRQSKLPRASTADLYTKITDPKTRISTLSRHVGEWLTKDPDAARAWVASSPALTAEQRAAILGDAK